MKKAFVALTESYGFVHRFLDGVSDRDFFISYAKNFPNLDKYDLVSYWMAGGYAAKLHRIGLAQRLVAPGRSWLSSVDESLTGRKIITDVAQNMPRDTEVFAKPAEAKIDSIKANIYNTEKVLKICKNQKIPETQLFQWTEEILNINHEHRFFVSNNKIISGSPYLIDKVLYHSQMKSPFYDDAIKAAEKAIRNLETINL